LRFLRLCVILLFETLRKIVVVSMLYKRWNNIFKPYIGTYLVFCVIIILYSLAVTGNRLRRLIRFINQTISSIFFFLVYIDFARCSDVIAKQLSLSTLLFSESENPRRCTNSMIIVNIVKKTKVKTIFLRHNILLSYTQQYNNIIILSSAGQRPCYYRRYSTSRS